MTEKTEDIGKTQVTLPLARRKVAAVGFAEGHRDKAPFDSDEWEIWGLNQLHKAMPEVQRWDRWFEIHDLSMYDEDTPDNIAHKKWLMSFPGVVYLRPQDMGRYPIPNAQAYPVEAVTDAFGRYFTNSISYMLALAIMLEPDTIGLWGVDMAQDNLFNAEYSHQRPSCEYFLGVAAGAGIEVVLATGSDLLRASHMYGLESPGPVWDKHMERLQELQKRKEGFRKQANELRAQADHLMHGVSQLDGAAQQIHYELRGLLTPAEDRSI